jgi:hypothetical protein
MQNTSINSSQQKKCGSCELLFPLPGVGGICKRNKAHYVYRLYEAKACVFYKEDKLTK